MRIHRQEPVPPAASSSYALRHRLHRQLRRRRRSRLPIIALLALGLVLVLSACTATHVPGTAQPDTPGFWLGLWHGFIAPLAFLISLFTDAVRVYAVPNVGRWYDFGFMLGIGGFSSGIFAGSRRRR